MILHMNNRELHIDGILPDIMELGDCQTVEEMSDVLTQYIFPKLEECLNREIMAKEKIYIKFEIREINLNDKEEDNDS